MVRNLGCTVIIGSVLANCKTQNASLSPVHAMFRHDCPLAAKPASMPRRLLPKKNLERFYTYSYAAFCCVCLGCCPAEFRNSGGTYELPCTLLIIGGHKGTARSLAEYLGSRQISNNTVTLRRLKSVF
jgi:hypothetical protein